MPGFYVIATISTIVAVAAVRVAASMLNINANLKCAL